MQHITLVLCAFFSLLCISGCGLFNPGATETPSESAKTWIPLEGRTPDQTRTDSLADIPFPLQENPIGVIQNLQGIRSVDTLPQENIHVAGQMDTVFTFFTQHSRLRVYKALDRSFLFHAQLMEPVLPLNGDIHIGMTRAAFHSLFPKLEAGTQHLRLKSAYVEQYIDFYFQQDTLSQIEYQGYLD